MVAVQGGLEVVSVNAWLQCILHPGIRVSVSMVDSQYASFLSKSPRISLRPDNFLRGKRMLIVAACEQPLKY